jgi:methyltransferase-like protein/SAM-dependent methyltransferase
MKTAADTVSPYDEVLYPGAVYPQTHPNRLATVAFLRGVEPAPINRCRVLELGCGVGNNLLGMAFQLPESEFIGLDLAQRPIATGQSHVADLGLRNISLHFMDVCDASVERFGRFDFIIAHGLYSWVPQPVRERILAICRELLNPQGVAYISYNAYPGNHLRNLVRWMMRFHIACFDDPTDKIGQARGLLQFLTESAPNPDYYIAAIRAQYERVIRYTDEAFFHDDLNELNQSFYFSEFIVDAERHGLQFVGEASSNELQPGRYTPAVMKKMDELKGAKEVVREQYKDFIRGCAFRQTLLCHKEIEVAPDLLVERIQKLYASCDAAPKEESRGESGQVTLFCQPGGAELETTHPLICAALKILWSNWPGAVPFEKLLGAARSEGAGKGFSPSEHDSEILAEALSRAYRTGFLNLYVLPYALTNVASERPSISKLARYQLEFDECATNQLHVTMKFPDPLSRRLVQLLDGTRDREMLVHELLEFVQSGRGKVVENGVQIEDMAEIAAILERRVREGIESLVREGMLVS